MRVRRSIYNYFLTVKAGALWDHIYIFLETFSKLIQRVFAHFMSKADTKSK